MKIYKITGSEVLFPKYIKAENKVQVLEDINEYISQSNKPNNKYNQGYDIVEISTMVDNK